MMIKESDIISRLPVDSVKFHQLQIVKDTPMAQEYEKNPENFHFFQPDEYVRFIADFLERLHPRISIERLAGEVPPAWNLRSGWRGIRSDQVIGMVEQELAKRDTWQGKFCKHF
jgi:radical SAM superfamily enzyme